MFNLLFIKHYQQTDAQGIFHMSYVQYSNSCTVWVLDNMICNVTTLLNNLTAFNSDVEPFPHFQKTPFIHTLLFFPLNYLRLGLGPVHIH